MRSRLQQIEFKLEGGWGGKRFELEVFVKVSKNYYLIMKFTEEIMQLVHKIQYEISWS